MSASHIAQELSMCLYVVLKSFFNWTLQNNMHIFEVALRSFSSDKQTVILQTNNEFSSVQSLNRSGRQGDVRDDSAEILFQSFLLEALVCSSGIGRDVHSLMLIIQHFLCRPRRRPPSKVP